jgi:lysosomal acid phosphatase
MVCVLGAAEGCMLATFPMAKPFVILAGSLLAVSHALKLELASVLFRHGDRSPTHTFPNDRYQESYWPQGFGQLSAEPGMRQEYFLGEVLRNRYVEELELIHPNYTRVQVYVRSTDYDRTLMSAESVLAALFPPKGDQIFNDTLPWQPIPVHTLPVEDDNMLHAYSNCPVYEKLLQEDKESQSYRDLNKENEDFFKGLKEDTGYKSFNLDNVHSLYGTLYIEEIYKLNLSSWVTPTVMGRLRNLTVYTGSLLFNSVTKNRLTAGIQSRGPRQCHEALSLFWS